MSLEEEIITYKVTVHRVTEGVKPGTEFRKIGQQEDGTDKYASVDVLKWQRHESEIFRCETPTPPDLLRLTRLVAQATP
jgi:hypothetical protein